MTADLTTRPAERGNAESGAPARPKKSARDPYFSNAKLILIVSVVCGHTWANLMSESDSVRAFYMTLYDFHMPAFILLCGYFSKSFTARPDQLRRVLTGILAPYLIFSILYGLERIWTEGKFDANILKPWYLTWFLAALFVWRMTAPIWRLVRHPIIIATLISFGAILMDLPPVLDLGRILQFLPFFVAGMYLKREHFEILKRPLIRAALTISALGVVGTAFLFGGDLNRNWIYFNEGAAQMDLSPLEALPLKLLLMATSVILVAAFFAWVPDRRFGLSRLGDFTMYTFLLHGFFVKAAEDAFHLFDNDFAHTAWGAIVATVAAVALALLLMSPPVRWATRPLVEPKLNWLFHKPDPPTGPTSKQPAAATAAG